MNTTLIFAELLIIGLEGGIWLVFFLLTVLGTSGLDRFFAAIKDWQSMVLALILPLLYVIGIILDRMADNLFKPAERKLDKEVIGEFPVTVPVMRFSLGVENTFLNQQLEYTRTRMRIVRASIINFLLIGTSISLFIWFRMTNIPPASRWQYAGGTFAVGLLFSYAALLTWRFLIKGHLRLSKTMYEHQNRKGGRKRSTTKD